MTQLGPWREIREQLYTEWQLVAAETWAGPRGAMWDVYLEHRVNGRMPPRRLPPGRNFHADPVAELARLRASLG